MKRTSRTILFAAVLLLAAGTLGGCLPEQNYITYEELKALIDDGAAMKTTTIVDVRSSAEWKAGYIPEAINVEYDTFIDDTGGLKDGGSALTAIVTSRENKLVIYGSGADAALQFAAKAIQMGYQDVKYYAGGMADWRVVHGDYLYITYEGFRQWYDEQCPFDDGDNYLVDAHPPSLYGPGYGHIPGAINVMSSHFAVAYPDSMASLTDKISNREAAIVFYCVGAT